VVRHIPLEVDDADRSSSPAMTVNVGLQGQGREIISGSFSDSHSDGRGRLALGEALA
jgi:hypothetical protein